MSQIPFFLNRIFSSQCKKTLHESVIRGTIARNIFSSFILSKKVSFKLSDIGEGIREVVVKEWFVNVGDKVAQFDNICEVQSDKASVTITSRYDGVITKLYYQIDEIALVGQPLIDLETDENSDENEIDKINHQPATDNAKLNKTPLETATANTETSNPPSVDTSLSSSSSEDNTVLCIPSVRRLAKEHKIDLTKVKGTGKQGRILKEDILKYLNESQDAVAAPTVSEIFSLPKQKDYKENDIIIEPIRGFTKAMVKTMSEALKIPHFVYSDEIKVTKLFKLRQELKASPDIDVKLTLLPFLIKAASNSLQRYPVINSSVDDKCENIIYKKNHNIGIAMATNQGLAVPVIRNVQSLTVLEIANELSRLIKHGKGGTFAPNDLSGATFTISNIGIVGGTYTKPVILPPQVSIIAIGKTQDLPRFDDAGNIIKEEIINVSGSADHRVIDGVTMANFIKTLKKQIENPNLLFLNL